MLDQFFECLNIRSLEKHYRKTKPFPKPYINENDQRFSWMANQFLSYPNTWKENTQNRSGDFTQNPTSKLFVSLQTYHSIQIAVTSTAKAVQFLFEICYIFILTEKFCQGPVEEEWHSKLTGDKKLQACHGEIWLQWQYNLNLERYFFYLPKYARKIQQKKFLNWTI